MKKNSSILFLSLILMMLIGSYPVYKVASYKIKSDTWTNIDTKVKSENLVVIKIKMFSKKIKWNEYNKEFIYNNKFYDIVKIEMKGDSILYYCLNDNKQTDFTAKYAHYIIKAFGNQTKSGNKKVNKNFKYVSSKVKKPYSLLTTVKAFNYFQLFKCKKTVFIEVKSPPPKFV